VPPDVAEERQRVVQREAGGQRPRPEARALVHGPGESEGPHEVRRQSEQASALGARLEDEPQMAVLEVADPAVDEPRRPARGPAREVLLLDERDPQATERGVSRDAAAGDAAADHQKVELPIAERGEAVPACGRVHAGT
jgi:hypothetical protein